MKDLVTSLGWNCHLLEVVSATVQIKVQVHVKWIKCTICCQQFPTTAVYVFTGLLVTRANTTLCFGQHCISALWHTNIVQPLLEVQANLGPIYHQASLGFQQRLVHAVSWCGIDRGRWQVGEVEPNYIELVEVKQFGRRGHRVIIDSACTSGCKAE